MKYLNLFRYALAAIFLCATSISFAQNDDDVSDAYYYAKKFKDDGVLCRNSYSVYTFDKGKNALGDKVVTIAEESQYDFLALQKYTALTYYEYYNKFIQIDKFKRSFKSGSRVMVSEKKPYDRSVTDDGVFFDDSRIQYYPLRFVSPGSLARIDVKKTYSDGKYLTRLFFINSYPSKQITYEFRVPDWLTVDFKKMNFEGKKVDFTQVKKGGYTIYNFTMKDVPARKSEFASINIANTEPHIILQIKSFENKGEVLKGFDTVDDVYAWNNRLYKMAQNDREKVKAALPTITKNAKTDLEKIKAIYYWVQDNNRYIAYEDGYSGYIPATAQEVYTKKYGDCKGMANLLTELLQVAGYDARFTWIGTRDLPYPQNTPALCVNNHAITALYYGGKTYFLDGTEKWAPFGENAFRIQGKEALISNGDKFEIVKVPVSNAADNAISTKAEFTLKENSLVGNVKVTLTGTKRTEFHQRYQELPVSSQEEYLESYMEFSNDNLVASNLKTSDLKNRELPVTIEGNIDVANAVSTISGNKYVGVDFFPKSLERLIPDEKRVGGFDIDDIMKFEDVITLTVDANKKFIDKPDDLIVKNDGYEFTGTYTINGNKITLNKTLLIKNNIVKKEEFPQWKKFIESIRDFNQYLLTITNK